MNPAKYERASDRLTCSSIRWPDKFKPEKTSIHVHNELEIAAAPENVWAWLVRAALWHTWYNNAADVMIRGGGLELKTDSEFTWTTFGMKLRSKVEEFQPPERLAWSAYGSGFSGYHGWLIQKNAIGCHVITEENQKVC